MSTSPHDYLAARHPRRATELVPERIAASFSGGRMFRRNGTPVDGFAALSGFFETTDGWVRSGTAAGSGDLVAVRTGAR